VFEATKMTDLGASLPSIRVVTRPTLGKPNLPGKRYRAIFTTLKKELPVKLTTRESLILHRAARLTLMAEQAGADIVFDDFMRRYDAAGDAAKTVAIRCAAKVMCTDNASAAEIHAALALLDRLPEKKAAGPQALTVTFVAPEPTQQEFLRERAENEAAALRRRVAELERARWMPSTVYQSCRSPQATTSFHCTTTHPTTRDSPP
jgi:hypothetical protein